MLHRWESPSLLISIYLLGTELKVELLAPCVLSHDLATESRRET
jgi:hypothetical protein